MDKHWRYRPTTFCSQCHYRSEQRFTTKLCHRFQELVELLKEKRRNVDETFSDIWTNIFVVGQCSSMLWTTYSPFGRSANSLTYIAYRRYCDYSPEEYVIIYYIPFLDSMIQLAGHNSSVYHMLSLNIVPSFVINHCADDSKPAMEIYSIGISPTMKMSHSRNSNCGTGSGSGSRSVAADATVGSVSASISSSIYRDNKCLQPSDISNIHTLLTIAFTLLCSDHRICRRFIFTLFLTTKKPARDLPSAQIWLNVFIFFVHTPPSYYTRQSNWRLCQKVP